MDTWATAWMKWNRWLVAGGLIAATALAGTAAGGKKGIPAGGTADGKQTFAASPGKPVSFRGTLDRGSVLVGGDAHVRMELVLGAATSDERGVRRPTDLVVILDRSGSMDGDKMVHARAAIRELIGGLAPEDRFALVTYSNDAGLSIAPAEASEEARGRWLTTVAGILPDGGTNLSSGLDLGFDTIERLSRGGRVARAIVISDGLANQGDWSPEGLTRRAARAGRSESTLTTVGVGADFNETLMRSLADTGTGNYYYVSDPRELANVFANEFDAARTTVASALEVRIEPGEGVRVIDAAGYPLEHRDGAVTFRPGSLFAGQERRIWVSLAVPNQTIGEHALGRFALVYAQGDRRETLTFDDMPRVASVAREDDFYASLDKDVWSRSVVVDEYNKMEEVVAREVKAGRRDAALATIQSFQDQAATMNARVRSPSVQAKIDSLGGLEKEVAAAFEGDDQSARQNELAKQKGAKALDERRVGAKR